ncbi:MAG: 30S ribosomal protein S6 [Cytophagales bacterium]|nr:30S ribosomal protein S6 [Cytophagales bacterium]
MKNYETVFIMTPVLTEKQFNDSLSKVKNFITECGGNIVNAQNLGLKKLAYKIKKKSTGLYQFIEFIAEPNFINKLKIMFQRDENVLRFLICSLDKHGIEYNKNIRLNKKNSNSNAREKEDNASPEVNFNNE